MAEIRFDTYYRYDAITAFLHDWAARYPQLCRLTSLGKSHEGRDIWIATLTNAETGPDTEKPAYWVDGNIHATEVSPSSAALYLIHMLLTGYGSDEKITYALDTRAFYIVPAPESRWRRMGPGRHRRARFAAAPAPTRARMRWTACIGRTSTATAVCCRCASRIPHGAWKIHPDEPRLMIPREPDDLPGGDYYRAAARKAGSRITTA